jgi:hypothetical protein
MTSALYVVTGLLAALLLYSAAMKLSGRPDVIESYARVGVPARRLPLLAAVLVVGVIGLAAGLLWAPVGVAAAAAFVLYFVLALRAHATHEDLGNAAMPALLLLLAGGATVLFALGA